MPKIYFITAEGEKIAVDAEVGSSLMETAIQQSVPGVTAECGGACSCATCHVYVDDKDQDTIGTLCHQDDLEKDMLEFAWEPKENSRLSCQIKISAEMEGMSFHIPAEQA